MLSQSGLCHNENVGLMSNQIVDHDRETDSPSETTPETNSFGDILKQFEQAHSHRPEAGQGYDATVVTVSAEHVVLDIGMKMEGTLPTAEFTDASGAVSVKPGDQLRVSIKGRDPEGYYLLSKMKVERPKDWSSLEKVFEAEADDRRHGHGRHQRRTQRRRRRARLHARFRSGAKDAAEMEKLVGQEITCKIIKLDVADEDVVVDRRVVLEEEEAQSREKRFEALQEGTVLQGTVRGLTDYGAFVDIGGIDGMLHVADISWSRVNQARDVLTVGQTVDVQILKVDAEKAPHRTRHEAVYAAPLVAGR